MGPLDAIVLAGGLGTRLRDALPDRQKVAAPVGGTPFLSRLIGWLGRAGVARVVLAAGYRADDVKAIADAHRNKSPQVIVSVETMPLGTGGAARLAFDLTTSDPILVLNGDSFAEIDIEAFRRFHAARHARVSLAMVASADPSRYGTIETNADGSVRSFREKQDAVAGESAINAGLYLFDRAALGNLPSGRAISLERDVFSELIGKRLYAMQFKARFIDIGTPESLHAAQGFFGEAI